jgi:hypothetical protein
MGGIEDMAGGFNRAALGGMCAPSVAVKDNGDRAFRQSHELVTGRRRNLEISEEMEMLSVIPSASYQC